MRRNALSAAALALCLALLGAFPILAEEAIPEKAASDPLERFFDAGWVQVSSGVLTRGLGDGKIEVLGFGAEGLRYRLREMRKHLRHLKATYDHSPTPELKDSIRAHRMEIRRILERLRTAKMTDEIEATTKAVAAIDCSNDYGVHVNAFALTGSAQGVGASATAYFNNDCGQQGEVYFRDGAHPLSTCRRCHPADDPFTLRFPGVFDWRVSGGRGPESGCEPLPGDQLLHGCDTVHRLVRVEAGDLGAQESDGPPGSRRDPAPWDGA